MTNRKTHSGFYVTAKHSPDGSRSATAYLIGPFTGPRGHMAALAMVSAATYAANRTDDPRFAFAAFGTAKLTLPITTPLPAGRLDLVEAARHDAYRGLVITGGYSRR